MATFYGSDAKGSYVKCTETGRKVYTANNTRAEHKRALGELGLLPVNAADAIYGPLKAPSYAVDEVHPIDRGPGKNGPARQAMIDRANAAKAAREQSEREAAAAQNEDKRRADQMSELQRLQTIKELQEERVRRDHGTESSRTPWQNSIRNGLPR